MIVQGVNKTRNEGRSYALCVIDRPNSEPVRVEPVSFVHGSRLDRRADFLTHLVAQRDDAPQYREKRRATPAEATRAYAAALAVQFEPAARTEVGIA